MKMKIIDSHIHVGLASFCTKPDSEQMIDLSNTYENTLELLNNNKIERAVLLPIPHKDFDCTKCNDYVFEAYTKHPDRFIPFCRIDENLSSNILRGFKGAKIHLLYEDIDLKKIKKQLKILEDAGLPIIFHALFKNKVKQVEDILKIAPNLNVILAHMGRGHIYTDEDIVDNAVRLKKYENVYFETSTIGNIDSIIKVFDIVGDKRVLYGSDYPFGVNWFKGKAPYQYSSEIDLFAKTDIDFKVIDSILYDNIVRLLDLNAENKIKIRRVRKSDFEQIADIFSNINETEKKYLALEAKSSLIRQIIKSESHCYVACIDDKIVGFMRESGRPEGYSLLEEIVVHKDFRSLGIATRLIKYYHNIFRKSLAKTNANNNTMILLLQKHGYKAANPNAQRIINWERYEE